MNSTSQEKKSNQVVQENLRSRWSWMATFMANSQSGEGENIKEMRQELSQLQAMMAELRKNQERSYEEFQEFKVKQFEEIRALQDLIKQLCQNNKLE